ncbi:MAG: DUF1566 domain-containing protein [Leptospiraceae bacterium]|nr:DUF1566 domain-containing protein [Leptospiraceae bacterium]
MIYGLSGIGNCASGTIIAQTWTNGIVYNNSLSFGSKSWWLPNLNELLSIVDYTKITPTINTRYWTSTTLTTTNAYVVSFGDGGFTLGNGKSNQYYVRCVSGP